MVIVTSFVKKKIIKHGINNSYSDYPPNIFIYYNNSCD